MAGFEPARILDNKMPREILEMALRGREMVASGQSVPEESEEAMAIARILRKTGVFGAKSAKADGPTEGYENLHFEGVRYNDDDDSLLADEESKIEV